LRVTPDEPTGRGSGCVFFGSRARIGPGLGLDSLDAMQFFERPEMVALARIDYGLDADKLAIGYVKGSGRGSFGFLAQEEFAADVPPQAGLGAAHAAEAPFVMNQSIDQVALGGIAGAVLAVKFAGEFFEIGGLLSEHSLVLSIHAVLQSVHAGHGLACDGAWAVRLLPVGAAGCDLFIG